MSDYAGPVLGAVGAVVGFVASGYNPAGAKWGWAIGSAIGGAYAQSQQVLPGPKIGDVQRQTSQEGGFRPIVYGRSNPIAGNVIADGGPVIVPRQERQGKGGPKVESESAYRTYAVGVCEGEATLLQAWRNGILVYDAEDGSMAAENAAFLEYATWYTGTFDQPASPDLEEIYGAGQAPYFRGTAYLSIHNEDVTDQRGAWSQWQVRVFRGAAKAFTTMPYPLLLTDAMSYATSIPGGAFYERVSFATVEPDATDYAVALSGGAMRQAFFVIDTEPDAMAYGVGLVSGQLRQALKSADLEPDALDYGITLQGGKLQEVLIVSEPIPDELDYQITLTGGKLS